MSDFYSNFLEDQLKLPHGKNGGKKSRAFPHRGDGDARHVEVNGIELLVPSVEPKFSFPMNGDTSVFTIGSCFAREIERVLAALGVNVLTLRFAEPESVKPDFPNSLLNQYNVGTMAHSIIRSFENKRLPESSIIAKEDKFQDIMLPGASGNPNTWERTIARRQEIDDLYSLLPRSNLIVLTLGLVEAWYDNEEQIYLNAMPYWFHAVKHPKRYSFHRLNVAESKRILGAALNLLNERGIKVLLTVSPVPMGNTFVREDCVVANEYSKSVLRVVAGELAEDFANVDYFPSYEIVRSGGLGNYWEDLIHVRPEPVKHIMSYMLSRYSEG